MTAEEFKEIDLPVPPSSQLYVESGLESVSYTHLTLPTT